MIRLVGIVSPLGKLLPTRSRAAQWPIRSYKTDFSRSPGAAAEFQLRQTPSRPGNAKTARVQHLPSGDAKPRKRRMCSCGRKRTGSLVTRRLPRSIEKLS
ncbi:MAG: hypothetical protein DME35_05615 [Verrucomicrobia bacterium]|nr:MAG: hypothetical protein DME35_05615 [Verrucomicrobiota bacterium]PYL30910.1 MAG: hypothetical protein DMF45_01250 [Verrucomicrobiota bacterium]